jgi:hypothetical protein
MSQTMLNILRKKIAYAAFALATGLLWGVVEFIALQRAALAGRRYSKG